MIVLDASASVRLFVDRENNTEYVETLLELGASDIHVPSHFTVELLNALRGVYLKRAMSKSELRDAFAEVYQLQVRQHPVEDLIPRIADLVDNSTPYDAAYVALAERLDCPLVTSDRRIADIPGIRAKVVIV